MAVEWKQDEDEEQQSSGGGGAQQIAGAPAMGAGQSQPSDTKGTSSGSYTNLQKYIDTNKGREFGSEVGGKLQSGADEGISQLDTQEGNFRTDVDSNRIQFGDDLSQKITNSPDQLSEDELGQATRIRENKYEGPTDFGGGAGQEDPYAQLRQYFGGLGQQEEAAKSTGGQKALLEEFYDRPTYSAGEKNLDALVLSGERAPVEAGGQAITDARAQYGQTKDELGVYGAAAKDESSKSKADYRSLLGMNESGGVNPYEKGAEPQGLIQQDLSNLYGKADTRRAGLAKYKQESGAFKGDLAGAGADVYGDLGGAQRLYGIDPTKYANYTPEGNINYQSASNQDDLARLNALSGLAGVDQNYLDESLVGTQDDEAFGSFEKDRFMKDQASAKQRYEDVMNTNIFQSTANQSAEGVNFGGGIYNANDSADYAATNADWKDYGQVQGSLRDNAAYWETQAGKNRLAPGMRDQDVSAGRKAELERVMNRINEQYGYNQLVNR